MAAFVSATGVGRRTSVVTLGEDCAGVATPGANTPVLVQAANTAAKKDKLNRHLSWAKATYLLVASCSPVIHLSACGGSFREVPFLSMPVRPASTTSSKSSAHGRVSNPTGISSLLSHCAGDLAPASHNYARSVLSTPRADPKSLPVPYAASTVDVQRVVELLEQVGAREYAERVSDAYTQKAMAALDAAQPRGEAGEALRELAMSLLSRRA